METFKNRAVGNRDGLKWKAMSSTLASDARKRADIPKESYTSQRKLAWRSEMEMQRFLVSLGCLEREDCQERKCSVGRRHGFDSVGSTELSVEQSPLVLCPGCVCVCRGGEVGVQKA